MLTDYTSETPLGRLLATADGREILRIKHDIYPAFTPDERFMAYMDETVQLYELATGTTTDLGIGASYLQWSPDGRYLRLSIYLDDSYVHHLYDLQTATLIPLEFNASLELATWTTDATGILFYVDDGEHHFKQIQRYDVASGKFEHFAQVEDEFGRWMGIISNKDWLAIPYIEKTGGKTLNKLQLYHNGATIMLEPVLNDWYAWDRARVFTWSPDGRWLSLNATDGLYLFDTTTETLEKLVEATKGGEAIENPYWSPDSQYLSFVQGSKLEVWSAETGQIEPMVDDLVAFYGWQFGTPQPNYHGCYDGNA